MQGQKDAGRLWYHLFKGAFENIGLHRSVADHAVFVSKKRESEMFVAVATDDCLCLVDDRAQSLRLNTRMEELFDMTLQEGATVRFLNLHAIQSPQGIIIDQTDHITDTIIDTYFANLYVSKLVPITSPFPTDSQFERDLYDSPILTVSKRRAIEKQYDDGSLYHWNDILLHVAITTQVDLGYAIMRISGYLAAQTEVIFKALDHTMRYIYLYLYCHMLIFYPRPPPEEERSCDALGKRFCRIPLPGIRHDPCQLRSCGSCSRHP
jgi:hypothetical protein